MFSTAARALAAITIAAGLSLVALPASADTGDDVPVGAPAFSVAFSPDSSLAYVATDSTQIVVMDTQTHAVVDAITMPGTAGPVAMSPDGTTLYAADLGNDNVYAVNTSTLALGAPIAVGDEPFSMLMSSDGTRVYVGNMTDESVSVIDTSTKTVVHTIPGVGAPFRLRAGPGESVIWVLNFNSPNVIMIDPSDYTTDTFTPDPGGAAGSVMDVTYSDARDEIVFVTLGGTDFALWAYDPADLTSGALYFAESALVLAGKSDAFSDGIWLLLFDGSILVNWPDGGFVATGAQPWDIALRPDGGALWVPTTAGESVTIFTRSFPVSVGSVNVDAALGDTVTIAPTIAPDSYDDLQWQYFDGDTWQDLVGETGETLDVAFNAANQDTRYRLVANSSVFTRVMSAEYTLSTALADTGADGMGAASGTAAALVLAGLAFTAVGRRRTTA